MGITQYCTFWLGDVLFGVDVSHVQEVMKPQDMTDVPLVSPFIGGLINLRGQIVTAVDLRKRLGLPARDDDDSPAMNIVVHASGDVVSLLVDQIGDVVDVSAESFAPTPPTLDGTYREIVSGVHKLDDGLMCLLDIESALNFPALAGK